MKLIGRSINDVLLEIGGPAEGINFSGSGTPVVHVQVFGSGGVTVFETTDWEDADKPSAVDWTAIGSEIVAADGKVTRNLTVGTDFSCIRLVVSTPGTGQAVMIPFWTNTGEV